MCPLPMFPHPMYALRALLLSAVLCTFADRVGPEAPPLASWHELCERPASWLGKTVRLRVQFQSRVEEWNPYLTRFGARRFTAIQAWADEQFPWVKAEFDAPAVRLFLRRGESCDWALQAAQQGSRFEVTATVSEVFLDLPWMEIVEVLPLAERITEGTVIHVGKAQALMDAHSWKLAELEIDQAITDSLPPLARQELERMRALCLEGAAAEVRHRGNAPPGAYAPLRSGA